MHECPRDSNVTQVRVIGRLQSTSFETMKRRTVIASTCAGNMRYHSVIGVSFFWQLTPMFVTYAD